MSSLKWGLAALLVLCVSLTGVKPVAAQSGCTLTTTSVDLQMGDVQVFNQCPNQTPEFIDIFGTVVTRTLVCSTPNGGSVFVVTTNVRNLVGVGETTGHLFTGSSFSFTGSAGNGNPCQNTTGPLITATILNTTLVDTTTHHGFSLPLVFVQTTVPGPSGCVTTTEVDVDRSSVPICF